MVWVVIFVGIGLAGVIMLISYAVWLAHKASDLFSELDMVAVRAGEFADLVAQIRLPESDSLPDWADHPTISVQIDQASAT